MGTVTQGVTASAGAQVCLWLWAAARARRASGPCCSCAGLIPDVLDLYPEATVVGSKVALAYLQSLTHRPFGQQVVKGGDTVDLGAGHVIEFVMAPNLHWPDTMFSFDHAHRCCGLSRSTHALLDWRPAPMPSILACPAAANGKLSCKCAHPEVMGLCAA